jgi:hypothetical protein
MYRSLRAAVAGVRGHGDLYFAALLPEDRILKAFDRARSFWQGWIYTPAVTVWVFLSQCFSADHSCRDAVARLGAWRIGRGQKPCSPDTGAYCTARDKLPETACHELVWQAELHLRSIKIVLQMDHLRCKTPERVRNEIWTHLLGYNLICGVMVMAGHGADIPPWCISFKGALQTLNAFLPMLHGGIDSDCWCRMLLAAIASHVVGNRPDRIEPRVRKRRPKPYKHMREPRQNYRNRMLRGR